MGGHRFRRLAGFFPGRLRFGTGLAESGSGNTVEDGKILRRRASSFAALTHPKSHAQQPVQLVFDAQHRRIVRLIRFVPALRLEM